MNIIFLIAVTTSFFVISFNSISESQGFLRVLSISNLSSGRPSYALDVKTLNRCSAKAFAFLESLRAQLPSERRNGGNTVWGCFSFLVALQNDPL